MPILKVKNKETGQKKKLIEAKSMRRGKDNTGIFLLDIDYLVEYSKENKNKRYIIQIKRRKRYETRTQTLRRKNEKEH